MEEFQHERQRRQANGQIDEENPAPALNPEERVDTRKEPAHDRADHT